MANPTRKIVCFSDFDGTIFMQDTGHVLFDNLGCGEERRQMLDEQIKSGERSFREVSEEMWGSLRVPFEDGFEVMKKELEIDQGFKEFHQFCIDNGIIFNVISAGLKPILRKVLDTFLGEDESSQIGIVANDAQIKPDGSEWKPIWRHETELGHDKAGLRLEEYCIEHQIPYIGFDSFTDVKREVEKIMKEDQEKTGGVGKPARFNPRANMWRRVSSKQAVPKFVAATPSKEEKMFLWPENFSQYQPKPVPENMAS
ncbi:HAD-like domain-containing protein [Aspergillus novoparasiticus]|uniref:HAD-like domain-containing protein n=1 Tax=Aspergillus novoparasiticus TaxID=986946 RepID=A0A5N6EKZ7_9EURO|nr:HAD-like domain-containing protein [Aspergillus novoparasiticus]